MGIGEEMKDRNSTNQIRQDLRFLKLIIRAVKKREQQEALTLLIDWKSELGKIFEEKIKEDDNSSRL